MIFTLGRFTSVKGPGLIIVIPIIQQMVKTDLRVIVMDVPTQDVISQDNVSVKVNAVVYFRIIDPERAIIQVANVFEATSQLAQTTLRSVLGQHELDEMLSEREKLNNDIQGILDQHTDAWGIKVSNVEIKHVDLDESMIRAIAAQAEAERARRAKVIHAEGETPGLGHALAGGREAGLAAAGPAAALPADPHRDRQGPHQHHRIPAADGPDRATAGQGTAAARVEPGPALDVSPGRPRRPLRGPRARPARRG